MSTKPDQASQPGIQSAVLHALQQPVLVCGQQNRIIWSNYAAEIFFDASSLMLARHKLDDFIAFASPILSLVESVRARKAPMSEYRVRVGTTRQRGERIADVYASPIAEFDGLVTLLFQERTMADKIERQLVSRGAARSATGLAAMLAHEIKNPLSGIRGASQLLEQTVSEDETGLTRLIRDETDRIVNLVDRVEVFGDERPVMLEPVNIHVILERVKLLAKSGVARDIKIVEDYDPSLPAVNGNADQLIQVFLNLLKNAAEALENTPKPRISIASAFRPGIKIGVAGTNERISLPLEIIIEDNGAGVPGDILPFLFDPFVTTKLNGSGLGLALVAKIIHDHGGVIECDSQPGNTRFRILLPLAPSAEPSARTNIAPAEAK
ncbi:Nitrogen regulation protein NtrB [hydrothermal vent metagenome]|uniref:Nitrogen regulation protein NtrB n=1 Tax=hydrothermal vent metagenome TaxID=652676 RepID=A0A3B0TAA4_9ZZZZ